MPGERRRRRRRERSRSNRRPNRSPSSHSREAWEEDEEEAEPCQPEQQRLERRVLPAAGGVACHVLHRPKAESVAGGRRNIDQFLEEIRAKHSAGPGEAAGRQRQVRVRAPERTLRRVIDVLARFVAKYGEEFEEAVRADVGRRRHEALGEAEVDFAFLQERAETPEALYYRWKAFALAQGDGQRRWRLEPFQMCQEGPVWYPPADDGSESEEASASASGSRSREKRHRVWSQSRSVERRTRRRHQERRSGAGQPAGSGRLGRRERRELARLLAGLRQQKGAILEAMCWCMDHADCAVQIARELVESLLEPELTLAERVLRVFLISDVVHNAGSAFAAANAWCFRREFEGSLPEAFEHLHEAYRCEGRPGAERAADQVARVLKSWQAKAVFSPQFVKGLEVSFFRDVVRAEAMAKGPDAIFVKLAEWRSQHFSQLEKLAKARGLNWQTMHLDRPEDGRSLEQIRKGWLLDRLVTYELHAWETRPTGRPETPLNLPAGTTSSLLVSRGAKQAAPAAVEEGEDGIDGESLTSGDEAWLREQEAEAGQGRAASRGGEEESGSAAEEDSELDGVPLPRQGPGRAPRAPRPDAID